MTPRGRAVVLSVRAVLAATGAAVGMLVLSAWMNGVVLDVVASLGTSSRVVGLGLILDVVLEGVLFLWRAPPLFAGAAGAGRRSVLVTPRGRAVALSVRAVLAATGSAVGVLVLSAWMNGVLLDVVASLGTSGRVVGLGLILDVITESALLLVSPLRSTP